MYFNIKCIGKLPGPTNQSERSLVLETGEFEQPKFDCRTLDNNGLKEVNLRRNEQNKYMGGVGERINKIICFVGTCYDLL